MEGESEMLKTYRKISTAIKAANGQPIIKVSGAKGKAIYIVGCREFDEIAVLGTDTSKPSKPVVYAGHVSVGHLNRLGNANWAKADPKWTSTAGQFCLYPGSPTHAKKLHTVVAA